jgi:chromosome segregation ATPase
MLGLDDLVVEMQGKLEQLEMMAEGLLVETQFEPCLLDEETIMSSLDSLIAEATMLEERRRVRLERDNPSIENRVEKYREEFAELREKKVGLNQKLAHVRELDVPAIMNFVRQERQNLLGRAIEATAQVVGSMKEVTREELNEIFKKSLDVTAKAAVVEFIRSYG